MERGCGCGLVHAVVVPPSQATHAPLLVTAAPSQQVRYYPFLKLYPRTDKGSFNDGLGQVLDYDDGSGAAGAMSLLRQVLDVVLVHDLASMGDGDGCGAGGECGAGAGDEFDDEDAFLDELDGEEDL